jgi:hypothetical protein
MRELSRKQCCWLLFKLWNIWMSISVRSVPDPNEGCLVYWNVFLTGWRFVNGTSNSGTTACLSIALSVPDTAAVLSWTCQFAVQPLQHIWAQFLTYIDRCHPTWSRQTNWSCDQALGPRAACSPGTCAQHEERLLRYRSSHATVFEVSDHKHTSVLHWSSLLNCVRQFCSKYRAGLGY